MQITTENEMLAFCEQANSYAPIAVYECDDLEDEDLKEWEARLKKYDDVQGAQLKQGIEEITFFKGELVIIVETPGLHPYCNCPEELKTKSMTGVLVNCLSRNLETVLLQVRGKGVDAGQYKFQGAAAGFGQFRVHLYQTAANELLEEAGIDEPSPLNEGRILAFLPFMVKTFPQPLAVYSLSEDISRYPFCRDMKDIIEFAGSIKGGLEEGTITLKEGYHFQIPRQSLKSIAGEIQERKMFHGPIYESLLPHM